MARTVASLPAGSRITDYISLGVLTKTFPLDKVMAVVAAAGKTNQRQRDLPAHVVVYYVIALTLYMQVSYREVLRCLLEGVKWLLGQLLCGLRSASARQSPVQPIRRSPKSCSRPAHRSIHKSASLQSLRPGRFVARVPSL